MFCQTNHMQPSCALPSPPGNDGMVPSAAAWRYLQHVRYNAFSMGRNFVPGDLYLWPWHSNSSERGTKHVFHVNLMQIRSAVSDIFHTQRNKNKKSHSTKNRTLGSLLCVIKTKQAILTTVKLTSNQYISSICCRPGMARLRSALRTAWWVTGLPVSTGFLSNNLSNLPAKSDSTNWMQCSST